MILNKSLLLYINHFDSINKNISNKECFYLNRKTKLQHVTKTKQNKTMELLTPAMDYCFRGLNRPLFVTFTIEGEARKLNPAKQSLFQHAPLSLSSPKKTNMNRPRPHLLTFGYY